MTRFILSAAAILAACSTPPPGNSIVAASVVIQRGSLELGDDGEELVYRTVCMGTAVSDNEILTAAHCLQDGETEIAYVDNATWEATTSLAFVADVGPVSGENVTLYARRPLDRWAATAPVSDGAAELVVVREAHLVRLPTLVAGGSLLASVRHGDSGAGVFREGKLVGVLQACVDLNGDDVCEPGARFSAAE